MKLPQNYDEFEVLVNKQLEKKLRDIFNQLKKNGCELVLCLENSRDQQAHDLFKRIAYTEYGKSHILSFFSCSL
jgi:predicted peroxiredoxin